MPKPNSFHGAINWTPLNRLRPKLEADPATQGDLPHLPQTSHHQFPDQKRMDKHLAEFQAFGQGGVSGTRMATPGGEGINQQSRGFHLTTGNRFQRSFTISQQVQATRAFPLDKRFQELAHQRRFIWRHRRQQFSQWLGHAAQCMKSCPPLPQLRHHT